MRKNKKYYKFKIYSKLLKNNNYLKIINKLLKNNNFLNLLIVILNFMIFINITFFNNIFINFYFSLFFNFLSFFTFINYFLYNCILKNFSKFFYNSFQFINLYLFVFLYFYTIEKYFYINFDSYIYLFFSFNYKYFFLYKNIFFLVKKNIFFTDNVLVLKNIFSNFYHYNSYFLVIYLKFLSILKFQIFLFHKISLGHSTKWLIRQTNFIFTKYTKFPFINLNFIKKKLNFWIYNRQCNYINRIYSNKSLFWKINNYFGPFNPYYEEFWMFGDQFSGIYALKFLSSLY